MHDGSFPLQLRLTDGAAGSLDCRAEQLDADERSIGWRVELHAGDTGFDGACHLVLPLPVAAEEPWFLFPGFFIGTGRAVAGAQRWPCLAAEENLPGYRSPSWDFALDRGAYPVLLCRQGDQWLGLSWEPHHRVSGAAGHAGTWGDSEPQVGCGLRWQAGAGELRLNLPANEGPRRHARCRYDGPTERRLVLPAGAATALTLRVWCFSGDAQAYGGVLAAVRTSLAEAHPPAPLIDHRLLGDAAAHGLLAWHWVDEEPGYWVYTTPFDRSNEFNANNKGTTLGWHFEALGFVGGFPVAFALLWYARRSGLARAEEVARRSLTRWCREAATEWGFFRTSYHPGRARTPNGAFPNGAGVGPANDDPSGDTPFYGSCWIGQREIHARTTADASLYLARCLALLGDGDPDFADWRAVLRRSLEAALAVQDEAGRFGQRYDLVEQRVAQQEGSAGLLWIPALHHAHDLYADDPAFQARLVAALQAAGTGYARDVEQGWIVGAPEDVDLAPTSEDGYNAVMAYAALHRRFGEARWLTLLQQACDWTLAWRKAYNVRFPRRNVLGAADFRTVGGDFASSHNNHLHIYGCNCGADFGYLADRIGDPAYRRRADEHVAYAAQLLCVEDGQWNGQRGMCSEQFYTSDWSIWGEWDPTGHHVQKGTFMGYSHVWCINMILLALEQFEQDGRLQW